MKLFSSKRRALAAAAAVLLLLFLVRPGVSRLKARIIRAVSQAVGRPADIGSVHLRFLPRPGFDLENFVIYEDPAFGSEPMLRAPEVAAVLRIASLFHGRMEIARLELTEPSLNLVHRSDGQWNWNALLERTAHSPLAPTGKAKSEPRAAFPYIEASSGRINFKSGQEKKPYSLLNADFALWQESENTWGARLKAEPLRTDMSLSDAGILRVNGTWQRASSLRETPLQFALQWQGAQLGQLSKLVFGDDKGWRGEVRLDANLRGTPAALQLAVDTSLTDFHRYDIASSGGLRLAAHCDAVYSAAGKTMQQILCGAPVDSGAVMLRGDASFSGSRPLNIALNLDSVPFNSVMQVVRGLKKGLPADLTSNGMVRANLSVKRNAGDQPLEFAGGGEISNLRLQSSNSRTELAVDVVPFALASGLALSAKSPHAGMQKAGAVSALPDRLRLEFGPFPVALGRPAPALARGWIGRSSYDVSLRGDAEVARTLHLAELVGIPVLKANLEGAAHLDLTASGMWAASTQPAGASLKPPAAWVNGKVQLHGLRTTVRGVNGAIEVSSAELDLSANEARLQKLNAQAAGAHWTGWIALPRGCGVPGACDIQFNLSSDEVDMSRLAGTLGAGDQRPWYQVLTSAQSNPPSLFKRLHAHGSVDIGRLRVRSLEASHVVASLALEKGELKIEQISADLFGGKYLGEWQGDFNGPIPLYTGKGSFTQISLAQAAAAMHDRWISGAADASWQFSASGRDAATFWQSANGVLQFELTDGVLPHISLTEAEGPLQVSHMQGAARLREGKFEIEKTKLVSPG
ncbi:MAG TPA: AsmA family protein [Candidatus Binatia bacterium]|nr:AsmA family protein [Candidatus Binatia bacterium]